MAKVFTDITLDVEQFEKEINDFETLLKSKVDLSEKHDILPFFQTHQILASQIGSVIPQINPPDKIAFEFDIFGDFASDLTVGNSSKNIYCFIEFEDARKRSLFLDETKYKPSFGRRLEHGYSQIIDWFCKLEGLQRSQDMIDRFNNPTIDFYGFLIIGRSCYLDPTLKNRLDWRSKKVSVDSKKIFTYTFDELLDEMKETLNVYKLYKNTNANIV